MRAAAVGDPDTMPGREADEDTCGMDTSTPCEAERMRAGGVLCGDVLPGAPEEGEEVETPPSADALRVGAGSKRKAGPMHCAKAHMGSHCTRARMEVMRAPVRGRGRGRVVEER